MTRLVAGCLAISWATALSQEVTGSYQVLSHDLPARVAPGQTLVGQVTWKVLTPAQPPFTNPVVDFYSTGPVQRGLRLPGEKLTPWSFPATVAAGDLLQLTFTLEIPMDFPTGPAAVALLLARLETGGNTWQYAPVVDPAGKAVGDAYRFSFEVRSAAAAEANAVPLVVRRMAAPVIDGQIQPAEWSAATPVPEFRENLGSGRPEAATRAWIGHDAECLYLAFECTEPEPTKMVRTVYGKHDAPVWDNECIEILLDAQGDRVSYLHFLVDVLNQRHDLLGSDSYGYNPAWRSAVAETAGGWTVEVALPFASLGVPPPPPGAAWYGDLCRERKAKAELSAWQPTLGSFAAPARFGMLVFDGLKPWLARRLAELGQPDPAWPPALAPAAAEWQTRQGTLKQRLEGLEEDGVVAGAAELTAALDSLGTDLRRLGLKAATLSGHGIVVTEAWPYERFSGEPGPQDRPAGPLRPLVLSDEWLDLAWNLTNAGEQPITVRLFVWHGDAKTPADHLNLGLPGLRLQWRLATPVAAGDGRPVYDALVPLPAGTLTVPPGRTEQVWLSLTPAPGTTAPATPSGQLSVERIDGGQGEPLLLPLAVTLLPQTLRATRGVHCFTWNALPDGVSADPAWRDAHLADLAAHGVDVCMISSLRHLPRVPARADGSLAAPLDFARLDALIAATRERFALYYLTMDIWEKSSVRTDLFGLPFDSPAYETAFKSWLSAVLAHLDALGISRDRVLLNPYDESVGEACRRIAGWIKAVDPQARVVIDCSTTDLDEARRMDALTDVWVPHHKVHFAADHKPFLDFLAASAKPHWAYYYSEGSTDKAQDPTRHYLAMFWWAWQEGITGVCYWAQQYYGDPWYRADWRTAYDTSLVYPVEGGLVASRRWEAWRRGWQDYQMLAAASAVLSAAGDALTGAELRRRALEAVTLPGDSGRTEATRVWLREVLARTPVAPSAAKTAP